MSELGFNCCKDHDPKQLEEKRVYLTHGPLMNAKVGTQDRNLETGTEAAIMEECYLLAHSSCLA